MSGYEEIRLFNKMNITKSLSGYFIIIWSTDQFVYSTCVEEIPLLSNWN